MVHIGIVGIGFMGMMHFLAARGLRGARVAAICSRNPKKLDGDWRGIQGNFGPPGEIMDLAHVKKYSTLDGLLADPELDLVDICNPTQEHPATAMRAFAAGKHVLVEKPIALDPLAAGNMVDVAREANRLLMVAHVLPFFPEFGFAEQVIRDNRFGRLIAAHFRRIISNPDWSADIGDVSKTGGPAVDLHVHDTHFINLVCGVPKSVFSTGVVQNDAVRYLTTQYHYGDNGPCVSCCSGAISQSGRPFVHGYEIYFERATMVFESGSIPLTIWTTEGGLEQPRQDGDDSPTAAFTAELQMAVDAVASGNGPRILSGELARDALILCHKECDSVRTGQTIPV